MRTPYPNELYHHGIMGMKWGIRRYQNPDGTLTDAGKKRYGFVDQDQNNRNNESLRQRERSTVVDKIKAKRAENAVRKEEKRAHEEKMRSVDGDDEDAQEAFLETPEGKRMQKEYDKAYDKYFNSFDDDVEAENDFYEKEERLLRAQMRAGAEAIVKKYGNETLKDYMKYYHFGVDEAKDFVQQYEDYWWIHAE